MEPDETPVKISGSNEAVCPRSSLGRSFSVQETVIHSVYLSPHLPTHGVWKALCQALGYKGKLDMADPCPYRDCRLIKETNRLFPGG